MKQTLILSLVFLSLTCSGQSLNIKAGTNYTSYARGGGGGYQFGPYFGAGYSGKVLQTDLIWSREGAKAPGRFAIFETHNLYVDYIKLSQTIQIRPCFGLSFNAGGYVSYLIHAMSYKWNYGNQWNWHNNFMNKMDAGLQGGIKLHLQGPLIIETGYSYGLTDVGLNGMEMDGLRNSRGWFGLAFLLNDKW